jgi:heavy metal sensor kinase
MIRRSIRFRLTIWYALALAAGLGVFALTLWVSMRESLIRDVDGSLAARQRSVESFLNSELIEPGVQLSEELDEYSRALPANTFIRVEDQNGAVIFDSGAGFPWQLVELSSGRKHHRIHWQNHAYRVLAGEISVEGRRWTVLLAAPLEAVEQLLQRLRLLLIALVPLVIALAGIGGNWLSRRALRPVDEIVAAARSIGIENLSARLVVPETGDELQRLSETWNSMLERLEKSVKRLTRFTADASHELRTPLAVIRTTAEIASRRPRSGEAYLEALGQIVSESERMTRLIEDLLFLARCDTERLEIPMSPLDLAPIVDDVCAGMASLAESKAVRLVCRLGSKAEVMGNGPAIRQLMLVLIDNAVKYSHAGGEVTVNLRRSEGDIRVEVEDSGPGIPNSDLPHIFERFYRTAGAREMNSQGSGLGLSLAAGIAQHHGAAIEVTSVAERGSTFSVVFPLIPAAMAEASTHSAIVNC